MGSFQPVELFVFFGWLLAFLSLDLLLDCCSNCRHKVGRVQVKIVAEHLSKLLCIQHCLIPVPEEGVPQLLALDVHVQPDRHQHLRLGGVLMHSAGVSVVEAERESPDLLVKDPAKYKIKNWNERQDGNTCSC